MIFTAQAVVARSLEVSQVDLSALHVPVCERCDDETGRVAQVLIAIPNGSIDHSNHHIVALPVVPVPQQHNLLLLLAVKASVVSPGTLCNLKQIHTILEFLVHLLQG